MDRTVEESALQPLRVKLDPGSKKTGIAQVRESGSVDIETGEVKREAHVELEHRGQRIRDRLAPVTAVSMERVRFDLQKQENPEMAGVEYQRGTLFGFEVREDVLKKLGHACAYCDAKDVSRHFTYGYQTVLPPRAEATGLPHGES